MSTQTLTPIYIHEILEHTHTNTNTYACTHTNSDTLVNFHSVKQNAHLNFDSCHFHMRLLSAAGGK